MFRISKCMKRKYKPKSIDSNTQIFITFDIFSVKPTVVNWNDYLHDIASEESNNNTKKP